MEHYFTENATAGHNIRKMEYEINEEKFSFFTDNAVFSKARIDYGSEVLIKAFIEAEKEMKSLLDVGCGYGPIGIILGRIYKSAEITMCDINNRALELSNKNIEENKIENVKTMHSNIYENIKESYEVIVTNPPIRAGKQVVHEILEKAEEHLDTNGRIYVVIQKKQGAESAKKKLEEVFGNCEVIEKSAGFWILRAKKEEV